MAELAVHSSLQGPCSDHHEDQGLATFWHGTRVAAVLSLASAVALAVGSYTLLREPLIGVDDANIYMAYGRNVAAGHGMVYYAGGERVEGFTSFAWMLVTAGAYAIAPAAPHLFLFSVSIGLLALTSSSRARRRVRSTCRRLRLRGSRCRRRAC